jgi:outer membrane biosynthesis protein TonB
MARALAKLGSLRFSRLEIGRLTVALLLSLFAHLGVWGGYEAGEKFGWWDKLQPHTRLHLAEKKQLPTPTPTQNYESEIFVDVSHAEPEPPKKTKYYSNKNSIAANPDAEKDSNQPKLNGKQKDVPKTEDANKLQLSQSQSGTVKENSEQQNGQRPSALNLGDLALSKPANPQQPLEQSRPRTLNQARAQLARQIPGRQTQQDGGVRRQRIQAAFDVTSTPFGEYTGKIVDAVRSRWYGLLDSQRFALDRTGKVTVKFKLKYDGTIEEVTVLDNTVGELLGYVCQEAIEEAAPFEKWPSDMRRQFGANFREMTFTFDYDLND